MKEIQEKLYKESRLYRVCSTIRDMAYGAMIALLIQIGVNQAIVSRNRAMLKNQRIYTSNYKLIKDSKRHIKELGLENVVIDFKFKPKHKAPGECIQKESNKYEIIIERKVHDVIKVKDMIKLINSYTILWDSQQEFKDWLIDELTEK